MHGTYIGPLTMLKGKTALLQRSTPDSIHVKAQFDDLSLPHSITHGWTPFHASDFSVDRDMSKVYAVVDRRDAFRRLQLTLDGICRHSGMVEPAPTFIDADEEEAAQNHWPSPRIRENY
jgi:hypothetical protein